MFMSPAQVARVASSVLATILLSSSVNASPQKSSSRRATTCNGSPDLCDRSFGNVTFVGAHDSYAVGINNLATNQDYNITQQMNDGIRMLQMQTHNQSGVIQLCHTSCALYNGGPLSTYLGTVKSWLDANPNEVLSMLIVNSDDFPPTAFDAVFKSVGLDTISYAPPSASIPATQWPTLGSLIDSGKRLLTFMDAEADFTSVPYIIDEFTNIWESPYDVTTSFDCSVNRTKGDSSTQMYLINHFLDSLILGQPAPDPSQANQTNAVSGTNSLGAQFELCVSEYGRNPNFMLVDFYEYGGGSVFEVAATANGVTYSPTTPIATPIPQGSSSSSSGSSGTGSPNGAATAFSQWSSAWVVVSSAMIGAWCAL
ncbi:PLC-like phosphodiesterase [Leucogyrophana mollusca]|uniref:PLC-like phosphodiesterase n=1 Tax=Leucogyrophana mollusca TaxID=85980 RepID=A0ACB8C0R1_9AGAM|nr:PLC-like phosphodiesterase [Leucogyrophana mollusca]